MVLRLYEYIRIVLSRQAKKVTPYGQFVVCAFNSAAMDGGATGVVNMDVYTSEKCIYNN